MVVGVGWVGEGVAPFFTISSKSSRQHTPSKMTSLCSPNPGLEDWPKAGLGAPKAPPPEPNTLPLAPNAGAAAAGAPNGEAAGAPKAPVAGWLAPKLGAAPNGLAAAAGWPKAGVEAAPNAVPPNGDAALCCCPKPPNMTDTAGLNVLLLNPAIRYNNDLSDRPLCSRSVGGAGGKCRCRQPLTLASEGAARFALAYSLVHIPLGARD